MYIVLCEMDTKKNCWYLCNKLFQLWWWLVKNIKKSENLTLRKTKNKNGVKIKFIHFITCGGSV
jgi:hypothetical protein